MVKEFVTHVVKALNMFPIKGGVSNTLSPRAIVSGTANPDYTKMKLEFGTYVQVFEDNNPTNTTKTRMTGAIAPNPTGNIQGDYYFMSLTTGERLHCHKWTKLPMSQSVIDTVERMAEAQGQPSVVGGLLKYEWSPKVTILDIINEDEMSDDFNDVDVIAPANTLGVNTDSVDTDDDDDSFDESDDDETIIADEDLDIVVSALSNQGANLVEDACFEEVDDNVDEEDDVEDENTEFNQGATDGDAGATDGDAGAIDGDAGDVDDDDDALENTQDTHKLASELRPRLQLAFWSW
jgi:hypothetical protein